MYVEEGSSDGLFQLETWKGVLLIKRKLLITLGKEGATRLEPRGGRC